MQQPAYEQQVLHELRTWQKQMLRKPSFANRLAKRAQQKNAAHDDVSGIIMQSDLARHDTVVRQWRAKTHPEAQHQRAEDDHGVAEQT